MFGKLFGRKAGEVASKFSGRTDYLEAVCAAAALIAAADGEIEDSEIKATTKAVGANKTLRDGFDQSVIEQTIDPRYRGDGLVLVGKQAEGMTPRRPGNRPTASRRLTCRHQRVR